MANQPAFEQQLRALIKAKQWPQLISSLEDFELVAALEPGNVKPFYSVQLLAYLIVNELDSARFLWKRIPQKIKKNSPELEAIWAIGKAAWQKKYSDVYKAAMAYNWDELHQTLVISFVEAYRQRMLELLAEGYSSVRVQRAAELLGMNTEEVITHLTTVTKWEYQADTGLFLPCSLEKRAEGTISTDSLDSLAQYVVFLEKK